MNDGIDISGSTVTANRIIVTEAGDKGISVGERSYLVLLNSKLQKVKTGIAVKDGSRLDLKNVNISEAKTAFSVFQKKREYPSAPERYLCRH